MAKLKKPMGRLIAKLKEDARQALPNGSPEELVAKAHQVAKDQGYAYDFAPDHFNGAAASKPAAKSKSKPKAAPAPKAATVNQTMVIVEAAQQVGGLTKLRKLVDELL